MTTPASLALRQRRVLMLEDSDSTMRSTAEYLEWKLGCKVDLRADANLLRELSTTRYDLIILDLMIHSENTDNVRFEGVPWDQTGLEFLRRLRQAEFSAPPGEPDGEALGTPADVPVIILSAKLRSSVGREVKDQLHVKSWFGKPCDFDQLTQMMRAAWGEQ